MPRRPSRTTAARSPGSRHPTGTTGWRPAPGTGTRRARSARSARAGQHALAADERAQRLPRGGAGCAAQPARRGRPRPASPARRGWRASIHTPGSSSPSTTPSWRAADPAAGGHAQAERRHVAQRLRSVARRGHRQAVALLDPQQDRLAELLDQVGGQEVEGVQRLETLGGGGTQRDQARPGQVAAVARRATDQARAAQRGQNRQQRARPDVDRAASALSDSGCCAAARYSRA